MTEIVRHRIDWISRAIIGALLLCTLGLTGFIGERGAEKLDDNTAAISELSNRMTRVETLLNGK